MANKNSRSQALHLRFSLLVLLLLAPLSALAQQSGEQLFGVHCALCHAGVEIERRVRNDWSGRDASQLFHRVRQTMPASAPGSLSDAEYLEVLQYMLDVSHVARPAGDLTIASLGGIVLRAGETREGEGYPWRNIHGELNANRYSPLEQINADNVHGLEVVWRWNAGNFGPTPEIRVTSCRSMQKPGRPYGCGDRTRVNVSKKRRARVQAWASLTGKARMVSAGLLR
jgi:hypothetical protein